jgi:hypothetical protein
MIDPLGPDPADPNQPPRRPTEVASEFDTPAFISPLRPKVRYANYDSPEALVRTEVSPHPTKPATVLRPASPKGKSAPAPQAQTALARSTPKPQKGTKFDRAIGIARTVIPLVGKMLPLLEGNVVSAASNLLLNRPMQQVDLKPLEDSIARLQADHRALAFHSSEQKRALHRLEDEFAAVQEAVQKNAADQAELIESVTRLAKRTSAFMRLVTILLVVSMLFTLLLCIRIAYIIRF